MRVTSPSPGKLGQTSEEDNFIADTSYSLDYIAICINSCARLDPPTLLFAGRPLFPPPPPYIYMFNANPCHTRGRKESSGLGLGNTAVIIEQLTSCWIDRQTLCKIAVKGTISRRCKAANQEEPKKDSTRLYEAAIFEHQCTA
eukprot:scaffold31181_cov153-Skeletonema_marinoi.AAC.6